MKHTIMITLLFSLIIFSCAETDILKEQKLQLLEKTSLSDEITIYKYKFNFEGKAWMDITAYVKKENQNFIITINDKPENSLNTYTYKSDLDEQNLIISNRVRKENVLTLDEAIEKSILFYLSDNI